MWRRGQERLVTELFVLEPLGPRHHDADFRAWTTSIDHIRGTPGFAAEHWGGDDWPYLMPPEQNLSDLAEHAHEFEAGEAFAYTVLDPADGDVIGCVYVDPDEVAKARCRLWVRADRAHLDATLFAEVRTWLTGPAWDLESVRFPGRDRPGRR